MDRRKKGSDDCEKECCSDPAQDVRTLADHENPRRKGRRGGNSEDERQ